MGSMVLLDLIGGVALLLWGLHMVVSGVLRAFGPDLRRFLGKALSNRVVVAAVFVKRHEAQLTAEAEQALPGPLELP
jgi:Na+/phosphate symporter